ncbi:uncharacterized protein EV422DRAFT_547630 [Fimicolochytrium jonesii]|uniref:uncharacterized protein n=1 Tax=Fimicolochytrium jonesii TaxID=1396493 RepID=UPI0022FE76D4|nr:uncharacterized protein EV422DRAFT_547630 [Fimicolochytrium jonesii]KAI8815920.1 hypothetical protein EV422DRAFT_547630 [Fimicolochytrium jonesii]
MPPSNPPSESGFKYYTLRTLTLLKTWWLALPVASSLTILICTLATVFDATRFFYDMGVCPGLIVRHTWPNIYHLLTAQWFHQNISTTLLNVLFFPPLNKMLETQRGSLHSVNFVLVVGFLGSAVYVGVEALGYVLWGRESCMGGLGAVMYALLTVEANEKAGAFKTRRIFGIPLPGALYPWLLLILSKLILDSPFIYNLSGILVGLLYYIGALKFLFVPGRAWRWVEQRAPVRWIAKSGAFVRTPEESVALPTTVDDVEG